MGVEVGKRADEEDVLGLLDDEESFIAASLPINLSENKSGESESRRDFLSKDGLTPRHPALRRALVSAFAWL